MPGAPGGRGQRRRPIVPIDLRRRRPTIAHMPRLLLIRSMAVALMAVLAGAPSASAAAPVTIPGAPNCPVFPETNVWNRRVDTLPVRSDSATLMSSIGLDSYLHPDFSSISGGNYGIPYNGRRLRRARRRT